MRVLFVTDSAFLPRYRGDSARIGRLIGLFQDYGWAVDLAHFDDPLQVSDYAAMRRACDRMDVYYATEQEHARRRGERLEDWCVPGFAERVERIVAGRRPDVVWAHFVYHSRVFARMRSDELPIRVIDADNIFAGRRAAIEASGVPYDWFSTTREAERDGLRRADLVVAIHGGEADYYSRLDPHLDVVVMPYTPPLNFLPPVDTRIVAFVGANNPENRVGLRNFLDLAWPLVRSAFPDAELHVFGGVCDGFEENPGVSLKGIVDDISQVFSRAAIGLNTTAVGTGLKIKSVDAFAHGRPLVSARAGVQGLEAFAGGFCIAEDGQGFATEIIKLFSDPSRLIRMTESVRQVASAQFANAATFEPLDRRLRTMIATRCNDARSAEG